MRWRSHRGVKSKTQLSLALREEFSISGSWVMPQITEFETEQEAIDEEIRLIALYGRENTGTGPLWNKTKGGQGWAGRPQSEETKAKIRAANLGKKHSAETKAKISAIGLARDPKINEKIGASCKGKKRSDESKARYRASKLGELNPFFGKQHTPEVMERIKQANRKER